MRGNNMKSYASDYNSNASDTTEEYIGEDDDTVPILGGGPGPEDALIPKEVNIKKERGHSLGNKSLNSFLSFVFIINQIYGPGVLSIPIVFQEGGFFLTTIMLFFFLIISCFSATLLCEALTMIPGNKTFDRHVEFTVAVKYFFGKKWYFVFQVFLNLCLQSYNIASIVVCAQSLDQFLIFIFKKTFALQIYPDPHFGAFTSYEVLYQGSALCISLGYIILLCVCMPTGFLNLDDNVKGVQVFSFVVLITLLIEFIGQFFYMGLDPDTVPFVGNNFTQVVSVFIFSWAYVMFVPSWVNEKKDEVSVNKIIWGAGITSFVGYMFIGLLCAFAYSRKTLEAEDDALAIMSSAGNPLITIIASYVFSLGVIAPGIPVCCITTRYNLYVGYICGRKQSYFWGVVAPWIIGFVFCQGKYFAQLLSWSSLILGGIVNFVVPLLLYYKAHRIQQTMMSHIQDDLFDVDKEGVHPLPRFLKKQAGPFTIVLLVLTVILVAGQIIYILTSNQAPLGGGSSSEDTSSSSSSAVNATLEALFS